MSAPIVHIGYHKTATTWLQTHFFPAVRNYRHAGKAALESAILNEHALAYDPADARARLLRGGTDPVQGGTTPANVILSHEAFSGTPHLGGFQGFYSTGMAERLRATLPDARIVVVLRNQLESIPATYKQYVRVGGTHGIERYLYGPNLHGMAIDKPRKMPGFSFEHFNYDRLIGFYEELFGHDRVFVFLYEAFKADPRAFLRDMAERLGLDVDVDALPDTAENVALGRATLTLTRLLNHFTARNIPDKRCVLNVIPSHIVIRRLLDPINRTPLGGRRVLARDLLTAATRQRIEQHYAPGNARLAARHGLPLGAYGYPVADQPAADGPAHAGQTVPAAVSV
ncbi:Sulfotransferase family protein [Limimonas halophila]|uniref:Sulfotransferase family protein n=1 Tax=Limimonas halophila TaxID=1082479 RepID=A0A1G7LR86_9PROT|nr:sulfotransferase [Limimonas halophila]SDF51943.1 Sulfotransferase family protein [Limimonas halophila]